jgi:hypothetical protein
MLRRKEAENTKNSGRLREQGSPNIHLIQSHHERAALGAEHFDRLEGLLLQAVHQVHHPNRNVAQARASVPQVAERFVAWGVDHQHARQLQVHFDGLVELGSLFLQRGPGKESSANLLRDPAGFAVLHAGAPNFVQEL